MQSTPTKNYLRCHSGFVMILIAVVLSSCAVQGIKRRHVAAVKQVRAEYSAMKVEASEPLVAGSLKPGDSFPLEISKKYPSLDIEKSLNICKTTFNNDLSACEQFLREAHNSNIDGLMNDKLRDMEYELVDKIRRAEQEDAEWGQAAGRLNQYMQEERRRDNRYRR